MYIDHNIFAKVVRTSQYLPGSLLAKRDFKPRHFRPISLILIGRNDPDFIGKSFVKFCTGSFYQNLST